MRVIFYDHTDKLRHGNVEPADSLDDLLARSRRRQPARAGDAGDAGHDRRGARSRGMKHGRLPHQQLARHRRRPRRAGRGAARTAISPARRSTCSRSSRRPTPRSSSTPAAGPRQRHPDAARRRLDRGGAGAHRRRGGAQVRRVFRCRLDHGRRQLPAGAAVAAPGRHALHPGAAQPAGRARPSQRRLRRATRSTSPRSSYQTDGDLGYVVLDADGAVPDAAEILARIRGLDGTIRARILHRRA